MFSHIHLFATPWTVANQALCPWNSPWTRILEWIAIWCFRLRDWIQVSCNTGGFFTSLAKRETLSPADLPHPEIKLGYPTLQMDSLPTKLSGKPSHKLRSLKWHKFLISRFSWNFRQRLTESFAWVSPGWNQSNRWGYNLVWGLAASSQLIQDGKFLGIVGLRVFVFLLAVGWDWNWAGSYGVPRFRSLSAFPFLSSKQHVQTVAYQGREGM